MLHYWILREPAFAFGVPVFLCAAVVFPMHLGWIGASWTAFAAYLLFAATLFALVDAVLQRTLYRSSLSLLPQALLGLLALAVPATLMFAIGAAAGPVDEAFGDAVCAARGAVESDLAEAESDDTFDMTAECVGTR